MCIINYRRCFRVNVHGCESNVPHDYQITYFKQISNCRIINVNALYELKCQCIRIVYFLYYQNRINLALGVQTLWAECFV